MKITLALDGGKRIKVNAKVFGPWAAHRSPHLSGPDDWRVTHVPSGCSIERVADGLSESDAIRVAKALADSALHMPVATLQHAEPALDLDLVYQAHAVIAEALS